MITRSQLEAAASRQAALAAAAAAVSKYSATRLTTFTLRKPTPEMYGIWEGFDFDKYDIEEKIFEQRRSAVVVITHLAFGIVLAIFGAHIFSDKEKYISTAKNFFLFYLIFGTPVLVYFYSKLNIERFLRSCFTNYLLYIDNVSAYRANLLAWEFANSERGLGYWRALRGIDFERAIALLFTRRGCEVMTTKSSGDGGVDLVLNIGAKPFWCQCKGHAKPIPVAPIREIAGVCNKGQAIPVILAVNGFTKPAIAAANEMGVTCLDASDLCSLARLEVITSCSEIVGGLPLGGSAG